MTLKCAASQAERLSSRVDSLAGSVELPSVAAACAATGMPHDAARYGYFARTKSQALLLIGRNESLPEDADSSSNESTEETSG